MADQFVSTEGIGDQYVVRFTPGGEMVIVNAGNAISAHAKGVEVGEMLGIDMSGGVDTYPATEADKVSSDVVYPVPMPPEKIEELKVEKAGLMTDDNPGPTTIQQTADRFTAALAERLKGDEEE